MSVDPKDRDSYEHGQEVSGETGLWGAIDKVVSDQAHYLLDTDSGYDAYHKGRDGEQLDGDKKDDESSGGCFLTTACVQTLGLPDDCLELTILRRFRDSYVLSTDQGRVEIREYYAVAPRIVRAISARADADRVYRRIYEGLVAPCVAMIRRGELASAHRLYGEWFRRLRKVVSVQNR